MSKVISDKEYFEISKISYDNEILNSGNNVKIEGDIKWKVLESIDNKKSGLQGAALVPANEYEDVKSGKKEPSNMIFVSRGTENLTEELKNIKKNGLHKKSATRNV